MHWQRCVIPATGKNLVEAEMVADNHAYRRDEGQFLAYLREADRPLYEVHGESCRDSDTYLRFTGSGS